MKNIDIKKHVPEKFVQFCADLQSCGKFTVHDLSGQRSKKLMGIATSQNEIGIDLSKCNNKTVVMLIYLHEVAHIKSGIDAGHSTKWKSAHRKLLFEVADKDFWGEHWNDFVDYYNTSPAKHGCVFTTKIGGGIKEGQIFLKDLSVGSYFEAEMRGVVKKFKLNEKMRKWARCYSISDQKNYKIKMSLVVNELEVDADGLKFIKKMPVSSTDTQPLISLKCGERFVSDQFSDGEYELIRKKRKWAVCRHIRSNTIYNVAMSAQVSKIKPTSQYEESLDLLMSS